MSVLLAQHHFIFSPCEWHIDGVSLELDTPMQSFSLVLLAI